MTLRHRQALARYRRRYRENVQYLERQLQATAKAAGVDRRHVTLNDYMLMSPEYEDFSLQEIRLAVARQETLRKIPGNQNSARAQRRLQHIGREILVFGNEFQTLNSRDYIMLKNLRQQEAIITQQNYDLARDINPEVFPERMIAEPLRVDTVYDTGILRRFIKSAIRTIQGRGSKSPQTILQNYIKTVKSWDNDIARTAVLERIDELGSTAAAALIITHSSYLYQNNYSLYILFWDSDDNFGSSMQAALEAFSLFQIPRDILSGIPPEGESV